MKSLSTSKQPATRQMPRRIELPPVKEVITTVSKSGTGAHVFVPKDWIGKRVKVIALDDDNTIKEVEKQE